LQSIIYKLKASESDKFKMTKKQTSRQKKVDSQKTVTKTVDNAKVQYDNMLTDMKTANVDSTQRIADNKEAHETKLLETKETQDSRNLHNYKCKTDFRKSAHAKKSRRALVIAYLHESKYTKKQIANMLVSQHDISDVSNNLKCVSGTCYDLQNNTTCNFKTDADSEVISCISTNCKYKHTK